MGGALSDAGCAAVTDMCFLCSGADGPEQHPGGGGGESGQQEPVSEGGDSLVPVSLLPAVCASHGAQTNAQGPLSSHTAGTYVCASAH